MAYKVLKQITVTILNQEHVRRDWFIDFDDDAFQKFFDGLAKETRKLGVSLKKVRNRDAVIKINSYGDLLNVVKISSSEDGNCKHCVGHIIGKSENLDILEDIKSAIFRIAFAPETIEPSSEFKKVCHNCGCGC
ncbi:MAG: hypothetical protein CXR30_02530 [Geobacter sp.]|nr:MAG: hypothetical protein CXR30_02530 [Geobacter sp.]